MSAYTSPTKTCHTGPANAGPTAAQVLTDRLMAPRLEEQMQLPCQPSQHTLVCFGLV